MKNLIRLKESRHPTQYLRTAWLLLLATAVMLAIGVSAAAASNDQVKAKVKKGTLTVEGTNAGEEIVLRLRAGDPTTLEVVTPNGVFPFARDTFTKIAVKADDGDDLLRIDEANGIFTDTEATTLDGEDDDDDLRGGARVETFFGGSDDDKVDGNQGNDVALLGSGDDSFTWDPGDASDKVDGQRGDDTLIFNGSGVAEKFDASANGKRLRFFRDVGNIVMDVDDTERVDLRALGGADNTVMNDLSRTDVDELDISLAAALGGGAGDGAADSVVLNGSDGGAGGDDDDSDDSRLAGSAAFDDDDDDDGRGNRRGENVLIDAIGNDVHITGLSAVVRITQPEAANDQLTVNTLGGNDNVSAGAGLAALIKLAVDGGVGDDTIFGGDGADLLLGGEDDDAIDGNGGVDTALMGAGDDTFIWDPGDGSDVVEGQDGTDTMLFNGAGGAEQVDLSANGNRLRFFRTQGAITMDTAGVERVDFNALGGADLVTVNDLTGTDVTDVLVDLAGTLGGAAGDGQADRLIVNATEGEDTIDVQGDAGGVKVSGLSATVAVLHSEVANDRLEINTLAGSDAVDSSGLAAGAIQLLVDGIPVP
jgi:Ca2+-binding RTX toxin-like protein